MQWHCDRIEVSNKHIFNRAHSSSLSESLHRIIRLHVEANVSHMLTQTEAKSIKHRLNSLTVLFNVSDSNSTKRRAPGSHKH